MTTLLKLNRDWLKKARKEKGFTVRAIAPILDTSFSYYSDIENCRRNPSAKLAIKIGQLLEVDYIRLLTERVEFGEKNTEQSSHDSR